MTSWWARRSLRTRITLVVGIVAVVALLVVGRVAGGLLFTVFVAAILTSAAWYYANYGLPDSQGY